MDCITSSHCTLMEEEVPIRNPLVFFFEKIFPHYTRPGLM